MQAHRAGRTAPVCEPSTHEGTPTHGCVQDEIRGWTLGWQYIDAGSFRTLEPSGALLVSGSSGGWRQRLQAGPDIDVRC